VVQEKLLEIDEQIAKLHEKKKLLEQKRSEELASLLKKIGLTSLDNETLAGAFLHIKDNAENQKLTGGWRDSGKNFLEAKQRRTKNNS
jgi:hypothetical protein